VRLCATNSPLAPPGPSGAGPSPSMMLFAWRSHGNEHWEFDEETGLMSRRDASINDYRIDARERRIATG
jgi:hypothetical protein